MSKSKYEDFFDFEAVNDLSAVFRISPERSDELFDKCHAIYNKSDDRVVIMEEATGLAESMQELLIIIHMIGYIDGVHKRVTIQVEVEEKENPVKLIVDDLIKLSKKFKPKRVD